MKLFLWNPLPFDVSTTYNYDGVIHQLTTKSEIITQFDNEILYNHMKRYLIEAILNHRGIVHFDHEREKVREEIEKTL